MGKIISIKIDVTKIEKERLYKGSKGTYLDAVLMYNDEADQYGNNGMIIQSVTKEEREAGTRGAILGNAKLIGSTNAPQAPAAQPQAPQTLAAANVNDDLPF
jgi:hypothetical protein